MPSQERSTPDSELKKKDPFREPSLRRIVSWDGLGHTVAFGLPTLVGGAATWHMYMSSGYIDPTVFCFSVGSLFAGAVGASIYRVCRKID